MRRLLLCVCFDGTAYCGWQMQNNAVSVQEVLTKTLETIVGKLDTSIIGCSRTDAGVHANKFYCHFETKSKIPEQNIVLALNSRLPKDISTLSCEEVSDDFHARYNALKKRYIYKLYSSKCRNPFKYGYSLKLDRDLDIDKLNKCCKSFLGSHDFSAFCSSGSTVKSTVREIYSCGFIKSGEDYIFTIEGNGFLYNMVRIIVGTLLDVENNKIKANEIGNIISSKDRTKAGKTAPPYGLYLDEVYYN